MSTSDTEISEVLRQIGEGREHLEKQKAFIARLTASGEDTSNAEAALSRFNDAQHIHIDQLSRLEGRSGSVPGYN